MRRRLTAVGVAVMVSCAIAPVEAKYKVYSPIVLPAGQKEVSYYADWYQSGNQDVVDQELTLGWGLTAKDKVSAYGIWNDQAGQGTEYTGATLEWIHSFGKNQQPDAWKFATYLNYQISDTQGEDEIEFRPLFEKTMTHSALILNGVFDKRVENWSEEGLKLGYSVRWALNNFELITPALEWYGDLGDIENVEDWPETTQLLGPVMDLHTGRVAWQLGALFGLTQASESVRVKAEVTLPW